MSADNWTTCPQCESPDKMREDYELGIKEGAFTLSYRAYCVICGWRYNREIAEEPVAIVKRKRNETLV